MSRSSAILLVAALASPGCAWLTQNHAATASYARQVEVASMRSAELEQALADAEKRLQQLEETVRMHGQNEATRLDNFDQVNTEINRIRGTIEELQFQVGEIQRSLEDEALTREQRMLYAEMRIDQLEKFLKVKPPPPPTLEQLGLERSGEPVADGTSTTATPGATGGPGSTPEPEVQVPATAEEKLEAAVEHMTAGRQSVARALLERALTDHPGAAETAEIRYRIGETWFNEGDFGKAVRAFQSVIENHGKSEWAAWAMLRQGESVDAVGKDGKVFYESVLEQYPRTPAAKEAKQRLSSK